jgi:hypothetical protein
LQMAEPRSLHPRLPRRCLEQQSHELRSVIMFSL